MQEEWRGREDVCDCLMSDSQLSGVLMFPAGFLLRRGEPRVNSFRL
jgi:hypothetical protein